MKIKYAAENSLLIAIRDIITLLSEFCSQDKGANTSETFSATLLHCFETFQKTLLQGSYPESVQTQAQYAVAALIDEIIMYSNWQGRTQWAQCTLQSHYFNDNKAGEVFFTKLQAFCKDPQRHKELIELYYVCLKLGFEGKYRGHKEPLETLVTQLYQHIKTIYEEEYDVRSISSSVTQVSQPRSYTKQWKMCLLVAVFLMTCQYMGYSMALTSHYHKLNHTWHRYSRRL